MRSLRRFATRWLISALCIAILAAPLVGTLMLSTAASAQSGTMEVTVVDFRNTSKVPNEMFGTMATDAVVVELLRSGKFSVTPADALQGKMEELGYKSKDDRVPKVIMTPAMMVRLGQEVGADSVVTGEITSIKVEGNKTATARIALRMLDVASGVWANGAIATGSSNPRIGYTADKETDLIIEAINNAARQAVESMVQYIIPEATIIGTFGAEEVLLNKGSRDGVQPGMELIVLRRGETGQDEVVGRVKISKTTDSDAHAMIMSSTRGLKPEDRVRAVFELPTDASGDNAQPKRPSNQKKIAKGNNLLWGLVALVGVATLFGGGGDKSESTPAVTAMAGKSPDITSNFGEGGIVVVWNDPKPLKTTDIVQFHVWRDNNSNYGGIGSGGGNVGPRLVTDGLTAQTITLPTGTYRHSVVDDIGGADINYQYATGEDHALEDADVTTPGVKTGSPHKYWVSTLYGRHNTDADGEDVMTYWETPPSYAGIATYLNRPILEAPGDTIATDYVDLSNVTFEWKGSAGANEYVIEVSMDPDFVRDRTWVSTFFQPTSQDGTLFTKTFTDVIKNADTGQVVSELANVAPGGTLYWRVGARNKYDVPGPIPAGPSPMVSGAKNTRFIYSDPNSYFMFMTLPDMPGEPPDDGSNDGSDDGGTTPPAPPL